MAHSDRELMAALREVIRTEINDRIDQIIKRKEFKIEDYRDDIETIISEYINYNVSVTIEG